MKYYKHGQLHNEAGPAILNKRYPARNKFFLNGLEFPSMEAVEAALKPSVRELTVSEISAKLGYEVKIVK